MAPRVDNEPKVLTDEEWHETNIRVYLKSESGPGKSDVWNWGEGFPDARARWIAVEVDLFRERMGMKDKQRAFPATVKVISYWEKDGNEQVKITWPSGGSLMLKLSRLCGLENPPSTILMGIHVEIAAPKISSVIQYRPNYSPEYNVVGRIDRDRKVNYQMRIVRLLKLGECR